MSQGSAEISDKITLLVFKDNYAARTFQIPLSWISRFGLALGAVLALSLVSTFTAFKYYRVAVKTNPIRVQDLEQEINDLRANLKNLESKPTSTPSNTKTISPVDGKSIPIFSSFPLSIQTQIPDASTLPFKIQSIETLWMGKTLRVKFSLNYTKGDEGTQEGKVLILARGPESLLAYPAGSFNRVGSESLFNPEQGESFSVSRFREVKADFGPMHSTDSIQEVEIFIFTHQSQLLSYQKIPLPPQKKTKDP